MRPRLLLAATLLLGGCARAGFEPPAITDSVSDRAAADGGRPGDANLDANLDSDTASDGSGPAPDGPLEAAADGSGATEGGGTVDFLIWQDLATSPTTQLTTGSFRSASQLTPSSSTTWEFDAGGDGVLLWMGRNEYGRRYMVTNFRCTVPTGAKLATAFFGFQASFGAGEQDALMICVERTFTPTALDDSAIPPGSVYCRRWPESGTLNVVDLSWATNSSPDIAPLIQRIADDDHGGQLPQDFTLQLWVSAAESAGVPYAVGVGDSLQGPGGKTVDLNLRWYE